MVLQRWSIFGPPIGQRWSVASAGPAPQMDRQGRYAAAAIPRREEAGDGCHEQGGLFRRQSPFLKVDQLLVGHSPAAIIALGGLDPSLVAGLPNGPRLVSRAIRHLVDGVPLPRDPRGDLLLEQVSNFGHLVFERGKLVEPRLR